MRYNMPSRCPVCDNRLEITRLRCPRCQTEINGQFAPCRYCELDEKMRLFLEAFLKSRGSIKEVERTLGISYPTVKSLLDELLGKLFPEEAAPSGPRISAEEILSKLENKEITADEAARLLGENR